MSNTDRNGVPYLLVLVLLLIALAGGAAAGILGYIWVTGGAGEASLTVEEALATREASEGNIADTAATAIAEMAEMADTVVADAVAAVAQAVDTSIAVIEEARTAESEPLAFSIISAESAASFTLEEDLRGNRTTVIGATDEVGGNIMVDLAKPSASNIGAILINARTLETDNSFRNRALRSQILKSAQDEFEFIVFEPRELSNFSAEMVAVGETITFDISGELTVTGVTHGVTFSAEVTLESETQIRGSASTNLLYADFGLVIPDVPGVANVTDDVDLRLDFVARASE